MSSGKKKLRTNYIVAAAVSVLLCAVMFVNIRVMFDMAASQAEEIGSMRMQNIVANLQQILTRAEHAAIRVGANLEEMLADNADPEQIRTFLKEQKQLELELSGGSCLNVFCIVDNEVYISGMEPPEGYVLQDRSWYKGLMAMKRGEVYISQVYDDAFTDDMCFTVAMTLGDGETIIGLDYSTRDIRASVEAMSEDGDGDALIADKDGTIVGYGDVSLLGEKISSKLPAYQTVFTKAVTGTNSGESFSMTSQEGGSTVFCNRTENGWYLMLRVSNRSLYKDSIGQLVRNVVFTLLIVAVFVTLYLFACRQRLRAEEALEEKEEFFENLPEAFRAPFAKRENRGPVFPAEKKKQRAAFTERERRSFEMGINAVFVLTMIVTISITTGITGRWSRSRLEEEARGYNYEVSAWILEQKNILDMFSYTVAAKPELLDDYPQMVSFLDRITKHYQGISATYIANPDFAHGHPMVMNNGWVPEEDYVEEERPWYIGAMETDSFSITEPYYDARTGKYCVTFSKKVETDSGEFLGVFAIDFYLDMLMEILGNSYSETGYAFLVDKDGRIINHPNPEYQFADNSAVNIHDMVYAQVYNSTGIEVLRDYDRKLKACVSMEESLSNFKVIVVNDFWAIYGDMAKYAILFLVLFGICIGAVVVLMHKMVRWQRETDVQLKAAADAARSADQAKSLFLAQMSHEIRTPINAVLGMNEMILRENKDSDIQEYAVQIQSAGATLLSLINGILDFTKIESGRMELQPVEYETSMLIQNLVNLIADKAQAKNLELKIDIDPTLPETLYGDDVRVRQIITNLLTNAVKYTQEGSVTLKIRGIEREKDDILLGVEVRDTGMGIREEDMERLFGMFQRLDEEKNRNIEGTGLGIPIVQNLLHMMGSDLKVESVYGKGSVFSFELKQGVVSEKEIGDYRQSFLNLIGRRKKQEYVYAPDARVLVVDDNAVNLRVTRNLLKRNGVQVDTASSGMECLERVREAHYHVIFLDHMMPQMDGIVTFARLKEEGLPEDTAVIMMTANETVGAREEYLRQGFTDYISKPIEIRQLENQLAKHLPQELVSFREVEDAAGKTNAGGGPAGQPSAEQPGAGDDLAGRKNAEPSDVSGGLAEQPDAGDGPIAGVDFSTGLTYCAESLDFYQEMLQAYTEEDKLEEMESLRASGDWKNYLIEVHALKSSSRTVGALELSEQALAVEQALREGNPDFAKEHHGQLMQAYREILANIRAYLDGLN